MYWLIAPTLISLFASGFLYQHISTKIDNLNFPAPGKFIDIGGYKLHYICKGKNGPSVLFDGGLGADSSWWSLVQDEVCTFAKTCAFDRAGYGWSDPSPYPRTSKEIVKETHTMLHTIKNFPPPYILVGHSFGGLNVRLYANTYPDEVAALILVDSCHEDQDIEEQSDALYTTLYRNFKHYFGISRWQMRKQLEPYFSSRMSEKLKRVITQKASALKSLKTQDAELNLLNESFVQVKQSRNQLTNKPLMVLSSAETYKDKAWRACQKKLVSLSSKAKHIVVQNSSHMITVDQPDSIVKAIYSYIYESKR